MEKLKENNFYKVDLQIHTPKSFSCYEGEDNDKEYLEILKAAKKLKIKIIAITDHNSIEGYKKITEIRRRLLDSLNNTDLLKKEKNRIEKDLKTFDDILVLPGIEFETMDCVHILIIFNDNIQIQVIENFITNSGYKKEQFGKESPNICSKYSILVLYDETRNYDCIVIDAHTDSNKGIYNEIHNNRYRAMCFSSEQLNAVSYKNPEQKDKLNNIIKTSKEYERKKPLAFIKTSDSHNLDKIGSEITWFKLEDISYKSLKKAFDNPIECISTEYPQTKDIIDKLINTENSLFLKDLEGDNELLCQKYICALNNTTSGHIIFGITDKKNKIGLQIEDNNIKKYYDKIFGYFENIQGESIIFNITKYLLTEKRIILVLNIQFTENLLNIKNDGNIYLLDKKNIYAASAIEIQEIIEKRKLDYVKNKLISRVENIERECFKIKCSYNGIPILKKFDKNSFSITTIISKVNFLDSDRFSKENIKKIKKLILFNNGNGQTDGNIIFIQDNIPPRYNYAYLRITPPTILVESLKTDRDLGNNIILVPGGGVFFGNNKYKLYSEIENFIVCFTSSNKEYSEKFLTAFLKSSFCLWYYFSKFDNLDFFNSKNFNKIRIPILNFENNSTKKHVLEIEDIFDNIVKEEKDFLRENNKTREQIEQYNRKVDELFYKIDKIIFKLLNLDSFEAQLIEDFIIANNLFYPKKINTSKKVRKSFITLN